MSSRIYELNRSRESMMQNEAAFPGEAVNTIALRMYFPRCGAEDVRRAVDQVTEHTGVFRLRLEKNEAGAWVLTDAGTGAAFCVSEAGRTRQEAEAFCRRLEREPFRGVPGLLSLRSPGDPCGGRGDHAVLPLPPCATGRLQHVPDCPADPGRPGRRAPGGSAASGALSGESGGGGEGAGLLAGIFSGRAV